LPSPVASRRHTSVSRRRCRPFVTIGCPTPSPGDGTPVCRSPGPVGPSTPFHADPVNRAIAGRRRTSSEFAVGVLTRLLPGRLSTRGPRSPGDSVLRSMWLLAPTRTAFASWIGSVFRVTSPEGLIPQTRSLDPGLRAGTRSSPVVHCKVIRIRGLQTAVAGDVPPLMGLSCSSKLERPAPCHVLVRGLLLAVPYRPRGL
jgi:hypothetical protein